MLSLTWGTTPLSLELLVSWESNCSKGYIFEDCLDSTKNWNPAVGWDLQRGFSHRGGFSPAPSQESYFSLCGSKKWYTPRHPHQPESRNSCFSVFSLDDTLSEISFWSASVWDSFSTCFILWNHRINIGILWNKSGFWKVLGKTKWKLFIARLLRASSTLAQCDYLGGDREKEGGSISPGSSDVWNNVEICSWFRLSCTLAPDPSWRDLLHAIIAIFIFYSFVNKRHCPEPRWQLPQCLPPQRSFFSGDFLLPSQPPTSCTALFTKVPPWQASQAVAKAIYYVPHWKAIRLYSQKYLSEPSAVAIRLIIVNRPAPPSRSLTTRVPDNFQIISSVQKEKIGLCEAERKRRKTKQT